MTRFSNDEDAIELPLHWGAFRIQERNGAINADVGLDANLDGQSLTTPPLASDWYGGDSLQPEVGPEPQSVIYPLSGCTCVRGGLMWVASLHRKLFGDPDPDQNRSLPEDAAQNDAVAAEDADIRSRSR